MPGFVNLLSEITDKQDDTNGDDIVGRDDDSRLLTVQPKPDEERKDNDTGLYSSGYSNNTFTDVPTKVTLFVFRKVLFSIEALS